MSLVGLDWNATRLRAVLGKAGDFALPLPLEAPALEMPAAVGLDRSTPHVGSGAIKLVRQSPHQACQYYLPNLNLPVSPGSAWSWNRKPFTAKDAALAVWNKISPLLQRVDATILTLPAYLDRYQAASLRSLATQARIRIAGSLATPLAAALAAYADQFWSRSVLVIDIDDYALSLAFYKAVAEQAHAVERCSIPQMGFRHWRERLLNAVADWCVWQTRRDPRDNPTTDQSLYEQIDSMIDACGQERAIHLALQGTAWHQTILIEPEQTLALCQPWVKQIVLEVERIANILPGQDFPQAILLTHAAGKLPGLVSELRTLTARWSQLDPGLRDPETEDFGENLICEAIEDLGNVIVLSPDAPARAAHRLAEYFRKATGLNEHHDSIAPLPLPSSVEAGPARLNFMGQDYFLRESNFLLGTQLGCQMRFDGHQHPHVADRHCEIVFDKRTFILLNRSRDGTLVNDANVTGSVVLRAGDRIRLGTHGPTLKFLGKTTVPNSTLIASA